MRNHTARRDEDWIVKFHDRKPPEIPIVHDVTDNAEQREPERELVHYQE